MQNNWYSNDDWYAPNYKHTDAGAERPKDKKRLAARLIALIVCVLVVGSAVFIIVTGFDFPGWRPSLPDSFFGLPDDWHDYLDDLYLLEEEETDVLLPTTKAREDLTLPLAEAQTGTELSLQEIYAKCAPSVVSVKATTEDSWMYSWGTGIIISEDGYIVTNTHVLGGCTEAEIGLIDGTTYEARLVGANASNDISLLKIDAKGLTPAEFALTNGLQVGDSVSAIGNPLGESYRLTMTNGIVSAISREINRKGKIMNLLQTNAAINEGNSGGPLFNDRGQVIGITNMKIVAPSDGVEGIGFAIPSDTVKDIVDKFVDGTVDHTPMIGVTVGAVGEMVAEHYGIPDGLYVIKVEEASDANAQGIKQGDIITAVDGSKVRSTHELTLLKQGLGIGDSMHFTVWRDGRTLEFDVALTDSSLLKNN